MRKFLALLTVMLLASVGVFFSALPAFAQATNTFPASGSVGIGTTSPSNLLDIEANNSSDVVRVGNSGAGNASLLFLKSGDTMAIGDTGSLGFVSTPTTGEPIALYPGNNEAMRLTTSGLVGIGTTSPVDLLDVNGAIGLTTTTGTLPVNGFYSPAGSGAVVPCGGERA